MLSENEAVTASPASGAVAGRRGALTVLLAYFAIYGGILLATDFMPYVMDNNETFSSLWHAANLYDFGLSRSWGLADEAFSPHAAAHPYVHTHQGNFPRLFAFLIYVFGARSAESQIAITTFTVGLAAVLFIYAFFARTANRWFACIVALVFMSDYVLFAQWQVVTYRAWSAFLLFACLYCLHRTTDSRDHRWLWLMALAFAALFYAELVFAAFVAIFGGLYVIAILWRKPNRLLRVVLVQGVGAAIGLGIFVAQAVGYLGWDGFKQDIYLTFVARNDFASNADLVRSAASFYEANHVVFWHNLQARERFSNVIAFVRSLTYFDWRINTPLLAYASWILCVGWLIGIVPWRRSAPASVHWMRPWRRAAPTLAHWMGLGVAAAMLGGGLFVFLRAVLGPAGTAGLGVLSGVAVALTILGLAIAVSVVRVRHGDDAGPEASMLVLTGVLFSLSAILVDVRGWLFPQLYEPLWQAMQAVLGDPAAQILFLAAATLIAAYVAAAGARAVLGEGSRDRLVPVLRYLVCGFAAYAVIYVLSPGYIYSGYLVRHAPFTVFLTDVIVAVALYVALTAAYRALRAPLSRVPIRDWRAAACAYARGSYTAIATGLALTMTLYWLGMQWSYVRWMPPDHYAFLKNLSAAPYRGASFVVDNYPAPVAAYTGQWAYNDQKISQGLITLGERGTSIAGDSRYLWFADRDSNPAYRKPQYFVCMVAQSPDSVLARILRDQGRGPGYPGCLARRLVRLARDGDPALPGFRLVALDDRGPERIGFDAWAIVELDWDRNPRVSIDWSRDGDGQGSDASTPRR